MIYNKTKFSVFVFWEMYVNIFGVFCIINRYFKCVYRVLCRFQYIWRYVVFLFFEKCPRSENNSRTCCFFLLWLFVIWSPPFSSPFACLPFVSLSFASLRDFLRPGRPKGAQYVLKSTLWAALWSIFGERVTLGNCRFC